MSRILKKENIVIAIREYQDNQGQNKKVYKTIGELVTMMGDDGTSYQFGEMWGATGAQKFNVYEQTERKAEAPASRAQQDPGFMPEDDLGF